MDNRTNIPVSLHPLMDFNQSFRAYENTDGANCQTVLPDKMTQKEAALDAVHHIGLNQIEEIRKEWFADRGEDYQMLLQRLHILKTKAVTT